MPWEWSKYAMATVVMKAKKSVEHKCRLTISKHQAAECRKDLDKRCKSQ